MSDPLLLTLAAVSRDPNFTNLRTIPGLVFDLRYATDDNFVGKNVYGSFNEPFLQREVAQMLARAVESLKREKPGYGFKIFDSLRPHSIQKVLFAHVKGTAQEIYVANPDRGSMHNYGCAVDLTVIDEKGRELDMGTGFDAFTPVSEPRSEERSLAEGSLRPFHLENRLILRRAMTGAGFIQLPHEWWHFDAFPRERVMQTMKRVD